MPYKDTASKSGKERRCQRSREWYWENRERILAYHRKYNVREKQRRDYWSSETPKGRFSNYKRGAKTRGFSFRITFEQFLTFWQKPCFYCDGVMKTIGLDRINSTKGYELENIISCCHWCNTMKSNYSMEDFMAHCKKIVTNCESKNNSESLKLVVGGIR